MDGVESQDGKLMKSPLFLTLFIYLKKTKTEDALFSWQQEAKKRNQIEIAAEKKRMEAPTESRGVSKQKWLEDRKKKIGKLLDANGLDMTKAYMLDTQEAAEEKYKKWEKDPAPFGWDGMFCSYPRNVIALSVCYFCGWHGYSFYGKCIHTDSCTLHNSQKIQIFKPEF